jgi:hypothetical protein
MAARARRLGIARRNVIYFVGVLGPLGLRERAQRAAAAAPPPGRRAGAGARSVALGTTHYLALLPTSDDADARVAHGTRASFRVSCFGPRSCSI